MNPNTSTPPNPAPEWGANAPATPAVGPAFARAARWARAELPVQLIRADGTREAWLSDGSLARALPGAAVPNMHVALELPDAMVLRRTVTLPRLAPDQRQQALELQAAASSPFAPDDLEWAAAPGAPVVTGECVEMVLASRRQLASHLAEQAERMGPITDPQLWVSAPGGQMVRLGEFGRARFAQGVAQRRRVVAGLSLLAVALAGALALTPTLQLRQRAIEAQAAYSDLQGRTAGIQKKRQELLQLAERIKNLTEQTSGAIDGAQALAKITDMLADDTALVNLSVQGTKVNLYGLTPNAASLMQALGDTPGVREVKAPQAAIRAAGNTKDTFSIDLQLPEIQMRWATADTAAKPAEAASAVPTAAPVSQPPASMPNALAASPGVVPASAPATARAAGPTVPAGGGKP